ncbi:MAG TPA: MoaD/ThiS family protein [Ramlibacter sp.]|jgi:molybdopterin synthase sulfur carrier subunit|uniref:MoaD/ThiS family protein n=1 Tax=Ramlibacter sp. TaxID=1917967 RepID=UPI002D4E24E1|nr:MoaD/ThiS family protein [Ramlibacter sp.]HZY19347.1 MoaD/ThiS family protein [Ramlibacter sp.]
MRVTLRYFASVREALGRGSEQRETAASTLRALREELVALGEPYAQALAPQRAVRMALDQVMAADDAPLREGCEVAFFPPVTGG